MNSQNDVGKKPIIINKQDNKTQEEPTLGKVYEESHGSVGKEKQASDRKKVFMIILVILAISVIITIVINMAPSIEEVKDSVVLIKIYDKKDKELSTGSGFCVYESNMIATNYHVIEGAYKIKIITDDGEEHNITRIAIFNKNKDIALLCGNFNLKPLSIGRVKSLKAGDKVTAIGSPKGEKNTVSTGIISNADDDFEIRITAPISPGSSGGVLLNKKNKVIGITYATNGAEDSQNLNYAISAKYLEKIYQSQNDANHVTLTTSNITNANYVVPSVKKFYEYTNKVEIFKKSLNNEWKKVFNNFSDEEQLVTVALYDELDKNKNKSLQVSEWKTKDFIINMDILGIQEYAVVASDLYKKKGKNIFKIVNNYDLSKYKKIMILLLLGGYNLDDFNSKDIEKVANTINDLPYSIEEKMIIYKELGFKIKGNTIYW